MSDCKETKHLKWHKEIEITKTIYLLTLPADMKSWNDITKEQLDEICCEYNELDRSVSLDVEVDPLDSNGNELDYNDVEEFCDKVNRRSQVLMVEKAGHNVFQLNKRSYRE